MKKKVKWRKFVRRGWDRKLIRGVRTPWATIFFNEASEFFDKNYVWWTWDADGFGGENAVEMDLPTAKIEARKAAIRQGFLK